MVNSHELGWARRHQDLSFRLDIDDAVPLRELFIRGWDLWNSGLVGTRHAVSLPGGMCLELMQVDAAFFGVCL